METNASARYVRMSAKKIRPVIDVIRGMDVVDAEDQLTLLHRTASRAIVKLLRAAIADAEHNHDCVRENLFVKSIIANDGPVAHRWMPKAFGRATPIRKRTAHIHVVLGEREEGKRGGRVRREVERAKRTKKHPSTIRQAHGGEQSRTTSSGHAHSDEKKPENKVENAQAPKQASAPKETSSPARVAARHDEGRGAGRQGFIKRIFNRKAG